MCVMDFGGQWDLHLPLIEFAYNNSYHTSIKMAPYEALYGRKCRSPLCWEIGERQLTRPELLQITSEKVPIIQQRLKTAFNRQKKVMRILRGRMCLFSTGDLVFFFYSISYERSDEIR